MTPTYRQPQRKMRDLVDPTVEGIWSRATRRMGMPYPLTVLAALPAMAAFAVGASIGGPFLAAGVGLLAATLAVPGWEHQREKQHHVSGLTPSYRGQEIVGTGLDLLVDITDRFDYAASKVDQLPDLVDWDDIGEAVEAIRWDAARHAAELSRTEARWAEVAQARDGSPQAALRARLDAQRADELTILRGYQRTADRLMNRAADAVAAAEVASELGYDLEVALPSTGAEAARATLEVVIDRLDALTAAWRALDHSTDLAAEALRAEAADRDVAAIDRAQELTEQLDRATGLDAGPREDRTSG